MLFSLALLFTSPVQVSTVPLASPQLDSSSAFGYGLDVSGDTAVAGAFSNNSSLSHDGFVQFYERDPVTEEWNAEELIFGDAFDRLGLSVAIDGDIAVLGHGSSQERPVRVLERASVGWIETARLTYPGSPGTSSTTGFGQVVDVSNGVIAVGASGARHGGGGVTGAAYIYEKQQGQWTLRERLLPPPSPSTGQFPLNTGFGRRVAIDGNTVAVSAWMANVGGTTGAGKVYVHERSGNTFPLQRTILSPLLPGSFRFGGYGFGLSGDTLAIGSIGTLVGRVESAGMVHVYERASGAWAEAAQLVDPAPSIRGYFGDGLSLEGDRIVVGRSSYFRRTVGQRRLSLSSFSRAGTGAAWALEGEVFDPLEAGDTCFGGSVSLDGDRVLASAPCAVVEGVDVGALYVMDLTQDTGPFATVVCGGGPCHCAPWEPWLGCGNSTRSFAELSAFGTASIGRDDLTFSVRDTVPNVLARLALGPGRVPQVPYGDGVLCIHAPRLLAPRITESDGTLVIPGGVVSRAASQLGAAGMILPGETWFFQVIYDEPRMRFPCTTHDLFSPQANLLIGLPYLTERGFNLTGGLSVTWRP